jgi:kinesin family member C2/C3
MRPRGGGGTEQGSPRAEERESDCCGRLQQQYDLLLREKEECRRLLEDLMRRENEVKTIERRQAQESLHHMKMELMRESMHVGSLASAVEGQVKEKNRLCQLLNVLSDKFKLLRLEHENLRQASLHGIQKLCIGCYTNVHINSGVRYSICCSGK